MKNKIISAMLVGMSATMAVPVTAVMAAENKSRSICIIYGTDKWKSRKKGA